MGRMQKIHRVSRVSEQAVTATNRKWAKNRKFLIGLG